MIRPQSEVTTGTAQSGQADSEWPYVEPQIVAKLMQLATELFGGKASIEKDRDPEYPDDKYYLLRIETNLSPQDVVQAEKQWGLKLFETEVSVETIRLLIEPQ